MIERYNSELQKMELQIQCYYHENWPIDRSKMIYASQYEYAPAINFLSK